MKKLDFIDRVEYNKLPQSYKDKRKKLTQLSKELRRLDKKKDKLKVEIKLIQSQTKSLNKTHNLLYKELEFINKSYLPNCYVYSYRKGKNKQNNEYLNLVIKHSLKTISIYLGKKESVIKKLQQHITNLNNRNYPTKINDFLKVKISELIKYDNPNWIIENTIKFNEILNGLEDDTDMTFS